MAMSFKSPELTLRPDSLPRLWRYINLLLTYLLTYFEQVGTTVRLGHKSRNPHRRTSWKIVGNPGCQLVTN